MTEDEDKGLHRLFFFFPPKAALYWPPWRKAVATRVDETGTAKGYDKKNEQQRQLQKKLSDLKRDYYRPEKSKK